MMISALDALSFGWHPQAWEVTLLLAGTLAMAMEALASAWRLRPRRVMLALVGLRWAGLVGVIALITEVQWVVQDPALLRRRVAVLVDDSQSMAVNDGGDPASPRWQRAQEAWRREPAVFARWREAGLDLHVQRFGHAQPLVTSNAGELYPSPPQALHSNLAAALARVDESGQADEEQRPLAALVVVSDGLVARDTASQQALSQMVTTLGVPVTALASAAPEIHDLALARPQVGEFAFAENVSVFAIDVVAHGKVDLASTVELRRNGQVVATQEVNLRGDNPQQTLTFRVAPERTGDFIYSFHLKPVANEATLANNVRRFPVRVLRDKVRVLHVAGRPDWDVRSLRTLLKRDPNVELLSYYILRSREDTERDDPDAPLSLIAFPHAELFEEQLGSFDAVVMQNFDASSHANYLENIARYVTQGGALVLIGGDLGLATGDYLDPSFLRILPIRPLVQPPDRQPFRPTLSAAGERHPITSWLGRLGPQQREQMPLLDSFNPSRSRNTSESGVQTLLQHPGRGDEGALLAVAQPGKGRVIVVASGSTWRFGFADDLPLVDGLRPYDQMWRGIFRWLLHDDASTRLRLTVPQPSVAVGEAVQLEVATITADFRAEPNIDVQWELWPIADDDGQRASAPLLQGAWRSDGEGLYRHGFDELSAGAYEFRAWRNDETRDNAPLLARKVLLVGETGAELEDLSPERGRNLMRELAEQSGGEVIDLAKGEDLPTTLATRSVDDVTARELSSRGIPLWTGWLALLAFTLTLPLEWLIRRRFGRA